MLVMMGALVLHTIGTSRALVRADASTSIDPYALCLGALGSHRISTSGIPRCLEQSRHMLVLLGPPISHTISTREALVHADACTSINSCLVLLGAPTSHNFDTEGFWYAKVHRAV